ncbi:MAG: 50S ribosomal protein L11 [Candidatus Parcubacteria bacterium]|nr:50S ribosomal protein L11 [Candidatus Parcubacteria bacterium]
MKKIKAIVKLQISAGQANPAPPIGPALASQGLNIGEFCQKFNEATREQMGFTIPVEVTVYEDRTYIFKLKQPLAADLIKKAVGVAKGSGVPNRKKVGKLTKSQLKEIAQKKMADLNTEDVEQAMKVIAGTARSMGIDVEQ